MNAFICDNCARHQQPEQGLTYAPRGWYSVSTITVGFETKHFCSPGCLHLFAQAEIVRTTPEPAALRLTQPPEEPQPPAPPPARPDVVSTLRARDIRDTIDRVETEELI